MVENSLRQSLLMSGGTPMIFLSRPISGTLLAVLFILVVGQAAFSIRRRIREK
jgi:putative tricarboxylic transport membrane protein